MKTKFAVLCDANKRRQLGSDSVYRLDGRLSDEAKRKVVRLYVNSYRIGFPAKAKKWTHCYFVCDINEIDNNPNVCVFRLFPDIEISKSGSVKCPLYGLTNCGPSTREAVLKTGYLPTGSGNDYKLTKQELERVARLADDVKECDLSELPAVRLTAENGYQWITSIAHGLSVSEVVNYFVGTLFNVEPYPSEVKNKCVKCEFVN